MAGFTINLTDNLAPTNIVVTGGLRWRRRRRGWDGGGEPCHDR